AVTSPDDVAPTADQLVARAEGMDALLVCSTEKLDRATIERLPASVRAVVTFSVGLDHIDLTAVEARGLAVAYTPDVLTDATADIAMLLILGAARRASEGERLVRAGQWGGWTPTQLLGAHLGGRRLGIVGMGRIGQALADRARAFGMVIHYHNRRPLPDDLAKGAVYHETVDSLLPVADVLSLHCPATPETRHLVNAETIARLPAGAIVVNTARGAVVDDDALIAALTEGRLFAAGLDVFEGEPKLDPRYLGVDNAFLLPHMGSATVETRNAMGFKALDNLDAFFAGRPMPDRVV
ncbi:MAG: D-glycerate dehydrogenase, partial [Alphaproteobacteria bacterium]|nr:D-glycerate dehydrogenase [Alphaproteobacteria bacterium]